MSGRLLGGPGRGASDVVDRGVRRLAQAAVFALAMAGPASAWAGFEKGPYLQALGPTAVTVKVELDADAPVTLTVRDPATKK